MEELFFFLLNFDVTVIKQHHTPDHNDTQIFVWHRTSLRGLRWRTHTEGCLCCMCLCGREDLKVSCYYCMKMVFAGMLVPQPQRDSFQCTPFIDRAAFPARACRPHVAVQQISHVDAQSLLCSECKVRFSLSTQCLGGGRWYDRDCVYPSISRASNHTLSLRS